MRLFFSKIFLSAIQLPTAQCLTTTTFKKTKSIPSYPTSSHFFPLFSNPSKSKIKYQITVSKDKLAHDLGLTGQMMIHNQSVNFKLEAPASDKFKAPEQLAVEISHATQKQKDRDIIVKRLSDGSYAGNVQLDPSKGKYYIVVHDPANSWRLRAIEELPMAKSIDFKPLTAFDKKS